MRIGRKLAMTYGLMSVLLVGLVFGAKLIVDRIDHDFDVLHHEFSAVTEELNNLRVASVRIVSSANQFAFLASVTSELTDDGNSQTDEMKELNDGIAAFNDAFARYSRAAEDSPNVEALNLKAVGAAGSALINESRHLADRAALSGTHFEQLDSSDRLEKLEHSLRQIITHTKANAHAAFEVRRHELGKMTGTISKLSWVGSVVLAAVLLVFGNLVTKTITQPLGALVYAAERLKQGDFAARVDVKSNDEIGELSKTFNQMGDALEAHVNTRAESETELKQQIAERLQVEAALKELNKNLEKLVETRTETIRQSESALVKEKERAETASQAKSEFLANMSHELRTLLNAIIGYSEIMFEDAEDEGAEERAADLQKIQRSGRHLLGLINDILDISKIEAGKIDLHMAPVDLPSLIADVKSTATPLIERNGNRLKIAVPDNLGTIDCDDQRLRQILLNLLSNAAKFTEDGAIGIVVERDGDGWVRFAVRDNGIGMSAEQVARIFEPFSQTDSTISKRYGGTGLGLAISQRFVEMLGGRLTIDSELGAGSCFTVWIPDEEIALHDSIGSGPRVLIIEDSLTDISLLERYLKPFQFRIEVARDGEQGLLLAREVKPALILLDIQLPGIDGIGVLKALRADADLETIPVIITSVHDAREEALQLGARGYITKPLDRHVLQAAIAANLPKPKTGNISAGSPALTRAAVG